MYSHLPGIRCSGCSGRQVLCSNPAPCFPPHVHDSFCLCCYSWEWIIRCGTFLLCQLSWLCCLPRPCSSPVYWGGRSIGEAVLLQPQHCSAKALAVIASCFPATNAKHSTARAAMRKSNSIRSQTQHATPASRSPL